MQFMTKNKTTEPPAVMGLKVKQLTVQKLLWLNVMLYVHHKYKYIAHRMCLCCNKSKPGVRFMSAIKVIGNQQMEIENHLFAYENSCGA